MSSDDIPLRTDDDIAVVRATTLMDWWRSERRSMREIEMLETYARAEQDMVEGVKLLVAAAGGSITIPHDLIPKMKDMELVVSIDHAKGESVYGVRPKKVEGPDEAV